MSYKLVFIGGGSVLWTPRLGCDLLLEPALDGSELHLVDLDRAAAARMARYLETANRQLNKHWRIHVSEEDEALRGADAVTVSISTGGFEAMALDYGIPEKYGVFHTVGDTMGPGGISRTLRNVPVFLGIARKMSALCPCAWMVHVTNPLSQLTAAVNASGLVRCAGLCHEYAGIMGFLKEYFGLASERDLDSLCLGVNHFTILKDFVCKGVREPEKRLNLADYLRYEYARSGRPLPASGTVDDEVAKLRRDNKFPPGYYINFMLAEKLGFFPLAGSSHVCEALPRFNSSPEAIERNYLYRKGVLPGRPERKAARTAEIDAVLAEGKTIPESSSRSREMLCDALAALCAGEVRRIIAVRPNVGQIANLPRGAAVETWNVASRCGINPVMSGEVPTACKGFMESAAAEQELTVRAAMTGDPALVEQALLASPLLERKECAGALARELLEAHRSNLPQFFDNNSMKGNCNA